MLGLRFDPALPVVASSAFQAGDLKVEAGDAFDWRAGGLTELDALALFSSGLLSHRTATPRVDAPTATAKQARAARR